MKKRAVLNNQRGIALISSLLLLLVVSLMAVTVSMDTSMDIRIAGYQRFKARSFGFAESGILAGSDILEDNISEGGWDASTGDKAYPNLSGLYSGALQIKQSHGSFYMDENTAANPVMEMTGDIEAEVVVQRLVAKAAQGGAIQMAAGYAGLGKGAGAGGAHVIYNLEATGTDASETRTDLALHFRHVTK